MGKNRDNQQTHTKELSFISRQNTQLQKWGCKWFSCFWISRSLCVPWPVSNEGCSAERAMWFSPAPSANCTFFPKALSRNGARHSHGFPFLAWGMPGQSFHLGLFSKHPPQCFLTSSSITVAAAFPGGSSSANMALGLQGPLADTWV